MDNSIAPKPVETIIERRELRFSSGMLQRIIGGPVGTATVVWLPPLPPVGITLVPTENRVDVFYGVSAADRPLSLQAETLGALLIAYCIRARIPLRRVARKEVRVGADYVTLVFHVEHSKAPARKVTDGPLVQQGSVRIWR